MCILFMVTDKTLAFGKYKLILASNRDEYYARPAAVAQRWAVNPNTIGGYDMETGREFGTWLAINVDSPKKTIKVGALLNVTGEKLRPDAKARGPIVADYVNGDLDNRTYSNQLLATGLFNVFNFITVEMNAEGARILYASNAPQTVADLPNGECIGIGNSPLSSPLRKVSAGQAMFDGIVNDETVADKEQLVEKLIELLKCDVEHWPDEQLAARQPQWGQGLSHINVQMKGYGTRTHTVILVDALDNVDFIEVTMATPDPSGEWITTRLQSQL